MPTQPLSRPTTRRFAAATAAALLCLPLAACGGGGAADADAAHPVSIGVTVSNATEPYVIPWLVAQHEGFFKKRGVTVKKIVPSQGGSTTVRNMLSGDLPIAEAGFPAVIQSQDAGASVKVVGGGTRSVYGLDFYALASNTATKTIGDIHTWAYTSPESVTQALTFMLPEAAGVSQEVKRVSSGGVGEGIALLESGDVDVAVVPPSVVAKKPEAYRKVVSSADYLKSFQQSVITTTPEYANSHPAVVRAVTAGYQQAVDWIKTNPAGAGQLYADYIDIDPSIATQVVKDALSYDNWSAGFDAAAIKTAAEAMKVAAFKGDLNYCDIFDSSFLPNGASAELPSDCSS